MQVFQEHKKGEYCKIQYGGIILFLSCSSKPFRCNSYSILSRLPCVTQKQWDTFLNQLQLNSFFLKSKITLKISSSSFFYLLELVIKRDGNFVSLYRYLYLYLHIFIVLFCNFNGAEKSL